jgi:GTP cyclohydrolase FolE2
LTEEQHNLCQIYFSNLKKIQLKNISDKVHLALRRCKSDEKKWTAKDVLNPSTVNQLVRLDEGYFIFRTLKKFASVS